MKIVIYPSNSSDLHHTGYTVLHIGKLSKSLHKRSLPSASSDSDTLPQAPPALHFPSLGGSIRRVSSAVSTNPGKKPLRLPPEAERRFIHSSSTIKWTPSLNPRAPADHSNSSKKTVQDLVVKLDQSSASGGGTRNSRLTMENLKTLSSEWTTETPVLPSEIPRLLTDAPKDPVQALPSSHQSTPQSSSFKIAPLGWQIDQQTPAPPTPSPITPPATSFPSPSTTAKRPFTSDSTSHSESPTPYKRPFFSSTKHGLRTQVRNQDLQLQTSLLENQKLRDEVTDAQNALYPEQCTKEEAKAQIRGLSSALQRINQLLKNSKEKDRIRDEEIQRQIYALEERRRQIKNLGEQITEKNARLEAQQEFLNSALDAGKEQKRKIKNQEMAIGWKNEGIAKRNAALKTKDEEIRKKDDMLTLKDELLEKKSAEIFRMEKKMESNMKAKDELIKKMEIGIKRKDVEVKLHIVAEMLSVMGKMGVNAKALRDLDRGQSSTDAIRKMGKTGTVNFFATGSSETSSKGGGKA